jgi:hypothetical protein
LPLKQVLAAFRLGSIAAISLAQTNTPIREKRGDQDQREGMSFLELSPNLGDGLRVQAAAVWD